MPSLQLQWEHHHQYIDERKRLYNPFTLKQLAELQGERSGVVCVWGADIAGHERVLDAVLSLRREPEVIAQDLQELPHGDAGRLRDTISRKLHDFPTAKEIYLLYRVPPETAADHLLEYIDEAVSLCKRSRSTRLRIVLRMKPVNIWKWLVSDPTVRIKLERDVTIVRLSPWTEVGIRQRLDGMSLRSDDSIVNEIQRATGGWHRPIEEFFQTGIPAGVREGESVRSYAQTFGGSLSTRSETFQAFNLNDIPGAWSLVKFMIENTANERELLDLCDDPNVSDRQRRDQLLDFMMSMGLIKERYDRASNKEYLDLDGLLGTARW